MSAAGLFAIGVGLAGCGLKGPLYMPTVPEAANRATLPSLILPSRSDAAKSAPADAAVPPPATASSAPASTGVAK